jgi:hypothetical protein
VSVIPVLSSLLPTDYADYIFPPLGPFEPIARILTALAGIFASYVAYFLPRKRPAFSVSLCAILFIASAILYGCSFSRYVRKVQIPSMNESVMVSIGGQRTEFAARNFPNQTDWEILRQRGLGEEEIERIWTEESILLARFLLWASLCGLIVFPVVALGVGIASQTQGKEH